MIFANHQPICIGYPGLFAEVPGHSNCRLSGTIWYHLASANFSTREESLIIRPISEIALAPGPNTDPCGTPLVTLAQSEKIP